MKRWNRMLGLLLSALMVFGAIPAGAVVLNEPIKDTGIIALLKAVRPLGTTAVVMNTAAHPDDEGSNWITALSLGQGVRVPMVTITRGQGGQNAIGPEFYNALGVLRTEELNKSVRVMEATVDYAREEFDSPCMDFGFSKMWEETEEKWDFDYVTERFVYYIRKYRPQIVVMPFNLDRTQHGHHQSIIICSINAIEAAADPTRYPEQGLPAYHVKKVYEPGNPSNKEHAGRPMVGIDTGKFDPWYGDTYQRISDYARSFHACQGMGGTKPAAPGTRYLMLYENAPSEMPEIREEASLFEGIPYDFREYAAQITDEALSAKLVAIQDAYDVIDAAFPRNDEVLAGVYAMQGLVEEAIAAVPDATLEDEVRIDLAHRLEQKIPQLARAAKEAAAIHVQVVPEDMTVVPGQEFAVEVRIHKGTDAEMNVADIALDLPEGFVAEAGDREGELTLNGTVIQHYTVKAPMQDTYYNAFHGDGIFATVTMEGERTFAVDGTSDGNFAFIPEFSVAVKPEKVAINLAQDLAPATFDVSVVNNRPGEGEGTLTLDAPEGWTVTPAEQKVAFAGKGEAASVTFEVMPPEGLAEGSYTFAASVQGADMVSDLTVQTIDYQHIDKTYYLYKAEGEVAAFPVEFDAERKIGYVSSGSDTVAETLMGLGLDITFLSDEDLRFADLSEYETIALGIRVYPRRPVLAEVKDRLLSYVEAGGNLVVQYHTSGDGYVPEEFAPYPFVIGNPSLEWRVTYEDSPVQVLIPDHPVLTGPNAIVDSDWDNWVQERSLYVPMEWDEAYSAPIRSGLVEQEGREYDGQILTAEYGEGTFTYTALVFFRQVPNLIPGGVRLFVNMLHQ